MAGSKTQCKMVEQQEAALSWYKWSSSSSSGWPPQRRPCLLMPRCWALLFPTLPLISLSISQTKLKIVHKHLSFHTA